MQKSLPIICDTHFGFKNDSQIFREYFNDFFKNVFFPYLDKNNIKEFVHLGDLMDRRKYVNFETLNYFRINFIEELQKRNIIMHTILGNHDVYYKNTNKINSIKELFDDKKCIKLYDTFQDTNICGVDFAMLPWVCAENENEFKTFIKTSKSNIAFGHLELTGFEVLRGIKSEHGYDSNILEKYEKVYSGHFHQKNGNDHVLYLGSCYDMTFSDLDETKGFHVMDLQTKQLEFIKNPSKMFYKIIYDDTDDNFKIPDFSRYNKTFVKCLVKQKKKEKLFETYIKELYKNEPHEINIIEEYELLSDTSTTDNIDISEDTLQIIYKNIDNSETAEKQKTKLKKTITDLYLESFEIES